MSALKEADASGLKEDRRYLTIGLEEDNHYFTIGSQAPGLEEDRHYSTIGSHYEEPMQVQMQVRTILILKHAIMIYNSYIENH